MNNSTKKIITGLLLVLTTLLPVLLTTAGCSNDNAATTTVQVANAKSLLALGIDKSQSVVNYRQVDTAFIDGLCRVVENGGGLVIAYAIGEPTDKSGIRCYLQKVPPMNVELTLSQQVALKQTIDSLKASNNKLITAFLKAVNEQILGPPGSAKAKNTDINGFFKKIDLLAAEPQNRDMNKYVFVYSDGMQSVNGVDAPAKYKFLDPNSFSLYLAGWKTPPPSDLVATKRFEDPEGFLMYMRSINSAKI
jgi:hypothetical protein